jgi:hypothetical protein
MDSPILTVEGHQPFSVHAKPVPALVQLRWGTRVGLVLPENSSGSPCAVPELVEAG